jgi:hypothetical protein
MKDVSLFLGQSARLDAIAAKATAILQGEYPEWAEALEQNRLDELEHARVLSGLAKGVVVSPAYAGMIASYLRATPATVGVILNLIERRSVRQFKMAYRLTRLNDLAQIAHDEERHVKIGTELLRDLDSNGPWPLHLEEIHWMVQTADCLLEPSIYEGTETMLAHALQDLKESLQ